MIDWLLRSTSKSIEGKYSFHLGYDPSTIDSSSTCNATAYADKERKAVIPCAYKWSLVRNGLGQ